MDEPIDFKYEDTDSYQNEISEIYSYSEEPEFFANRNAFEESMEDCGLPLTWKHMVPEQRKRAIAYLIATLEVSCRSTRIKSCRALAYLIQGNFGECLSLEEQANNSKANVLLLYKHGIHQSFVQQLLIESNIHLSKENNKNSNDKNSQNHSLDPPSIRLYNQSTELRLILAVLCTIAETMYHFKDSDDQEHLETRKQFIFELQNPLNDELLIVKLFQMLDRFCSGQAPHYPVKKITILLWKLILLNLGGSEDLKKLKAERRRISNLDPVPDDTLEVSKHMTPCIPPLNQSNQARSRPGPSGGSALAQKRKVFKQPAFDDAVFAYAKECLLNSLAELNQTEDKDMETMELKSNDDSASNVDSGAKSLEEEPDLDALVESAEKNDQDNPQSVEDETEIPPETDSTESRNTIFSDFDFDPGEIPALKNNDDSTAISNNKSEPLKQLGDRLFGSSQLDGSRSDVSQLYRGLPWAPKVRKTDLCQHLSNLRVKFLGYTLPDDVETTFGLPEPIVEGINVLKKHLYVSLAEAQLEREEKIQRFPLTHGEMIQNYDDEPAERLYQALLPRLPQYMIAILKILLAASTSSKYKTEKVESINILAEINPDVSSQSVVHLMKMTADSSRHEGIIIKAISAILLLLLKHFKINHVYQFEYVSQQLMFANCIPLILKFLSQDVYQYIVTSRSNISAVDFPACVIGEPPELTADAIELSSFQPYCWRNMFSCINLVRVLNKLTKWKHSRIMMLVVFKSSQTLIKALNVRHSMFQLYVLKLLKIQLKFLGRQWKKNNMRLISPIYQKVRHRLTDDWAYSSDNEAKPWDFQAEEFALQNNINKFQHRRYKHIIATPAYQKSNHAAPQSDHLSGNFDELFTSSMDLSEEEKYEIFEPGKVVPYFSIAYEKWLEGEVFQRNIDWDKLLQCC